MSNKKLASSQFCLALEHAILWAKIGVARAKLRPEEALACECMLQVGKSGMYRDPRLSQDKYFGTS
jgi:hypothetical protein